MKLDNLRSKLRQFNTVHPTKSFEHTFGEKKIGDIRKLNSIFKDVFLNDNIEIKTLEDNGKEIKLIGVTGSHGKSSVAYIIHNFLKFKGFKSVLYSSVSIDSPSSFKKPDEAVENPLIDEQMLLNAIEEAYAYNADYLVLEVNERAIEKGLTKEIPFDLRIITNINPTHNKFFYSNYVEIKKKFFQEINNEDNTICIFGVDDKVLFDDLYDINANKKVTFMSNYVMNKRGINPSKIDYLLTAGQTFDTINGLKFTIKTSNKAYEIETNLLFPHNGLNLTCVVAALETLGVFDYEQFNNFIKLFNVPGVDEVYKFNNKTIIVTRSLSPNLEQLSKYRNNNEINHIHVVMGASGLGYKSWVQEFSNQAYISEKEYAVEFAYNYAQNHADHIYITSNDNGAMDVNDLLEYQASFIKDASKVKKIADRTTAIREAVLNAKENDVILITGRGNRRVMCINRVDRVLHLDSDIVKQLIKYKGEK
ncbi:UDP-N-acetylmuramoyl-L-alanyl-D-glutamate--LD-lysine ligase [Acholeplasma oculi]|uniref:Putative MurD-like peptide ligase n=1 Tax=Acholeplasma oculi TaxID=35623 RepID=A0A061A934_9MOLU|nr:Mur ligase family protein [Acholeplasma oculi]CDR30358.1 putative MurD-like peptide ligase [Acholeplasma oculi]SKC42321.1 UDP-N-acetylmuramoylalanyl-D-glutamate--2,6-diaminopimelate ligase [Acholeplasma oculi]SUT88864.1 UDP-N-acetylmuramoyl-L-alanyl-D-glutamate--LD-lysine ligase [Acholeplasma oculi]